MRNASLWEFALAAFVLWVVMEYIPQGVFIGVFILILAMLETPSAINGIANLLNFVQTGSISHSTPVTVGVIKL